MRAARGVVVRLELGARATARDERVKAAGREVERRDAADVDEGVELLDALQRRVGDARVADVRVAEKEARVQVVGAHVRVVDDGQAPDAAEHDVFDDLGRDAREAEDDDVRGAHAVLGLEAPQPDLAVIQRGLVLGHAARRAVGHGEQAGARARRSWLTKRNTAMVHGRAYARTSHAAAASDTALTSARLAAVRAPAPWASDWSTIRYDGVCPGLDTA
mgnify:CR=1 FL=1